MTDEPKKPTALQRAWAGGVFDAKFLFPKTGYTLRFDTADRVLCDVFCGIVGVGYVKPREKNDCIRPQWMYQTNTMDDSRELLLFVAPFIQALRVKQASEMLARIERSPVWQKKNPEKVASSVTVNVS